MLGSPRAGFTFHILKNHVIVVTVPAGKRSVVTLKTSANLIFTVRMEISSFLLENVALSANKWLPQVSSYLWCMMA